MFHHVTLLEKVVGDYNLEGEGCLQGGQVEEEKIPKTKDNVIEIWNERALEEGQGYSNGSLNKFPLFFYNIKTSFKNKI